MSSWSIKQRLVTGFSVVTVAFTLLAGFAFLNLRQVSVSANRIAVDALPGLATITHMEAATRQTLAETAEHVFASDAANKADKRKNVRDLDADMDENWRRYEGTITLDEDRQLFAKLATSRQAFVEARDKVLTLSDAMNTDGAIGLYRTELEATYDQHSQDFDAIVAFNKENGDRSSAEILSAVSSGQFGMLLGTLLTVIGAVCISVYIVKGTNDVLSGAIGELAAGAVQVTAAAQEVASASQGLSQGATTQAASLEETSASMEEMASMTRQNAENAGHAASLMVDTEQAVQASNAALQALVSSMGSIQDSSGKVAKIIKTIDEIAFQTNILALNAAVEAARAGEAGMGFAVVADEVRNLAQRSARAAKDTAGLIEESIAISQEGQSKVDQMATAISSITEYASKVKGLVDSVSSASKEQAQGVDQVAQALSQMEKVTQENAATAEESAAASEELSAQAETTSSIVDQLSTLVGGTSARQGHVPSPSGRVSKRPAKKLLASVSKMPVRVASKAPMNPEDEFPLEDTGTFGKF